MVSNLPRALQMHFYERQAQAYLRSLPLEHFMESTAQATQRKITVESLDLVQARRPDVQVFNELLVQYPLRGRRKLGQVVPDNMIVIATEPISARSSYNVPLEPAGPYCVMEYVSPSNPRKDYEDSFRKYERDLKVPYYLVFHPDDQELKLYRHNKQKYVKVRPNSSGRLAIAKLDLEVALLDGWVRYWHEGKLLPLPAEMQRELDQARRRAAEEKRRADDEKKRADDLQAKLAAAEKELAELRRRR